MDRTTLIQPERVLPDSEASSKRALLTEMAHSLSSMDPDRVLEVVMAREHLGSTGIGHGVAIPHGRMPDLANPVIALVRHKTGIDFDSIDGAPVHIVILLLVPDSEDRAHLELLARLARLLQQGSFRDAIMHADSPGAISELFCEESLQ
ncbi:MAG: PTS sugar transporter subunit IIA [Mariprofundaceae bacterium]|jgi:mannitol/fructose-specific phosphotransferase system IIA component (Ntr-type)|nr:PTS sugar transporter subunit IIA [Mariprofundaceae bacterium]